MKRFLVIILSILYMASAMGATVEFHYCMGHNMGANFVHKSDDKCRKCGMHKSKSKGCCHDEHKTFKTSEHNHSKAGHTDLDWVACLPAKTYTYRTVCHTADIYTITASPNAPPDARHDRPIYILFRNLRI